MCPILEVIFIIYKNYIDMIVSPTTLNYLGQHDHSFDLKTNRGSESLHPIITTLIGGKGVLISVVENQDIRLTLASSEGTSSYL